MKNFVITTVTLFDRVICTSNNLIKSRMRIQKFKTHARRSTLAFE